MPYRISRQADEDLIEIAVYGISRFGIDQAKRYHDALERVFGLIADNPRMGRRIVGNPNRRRFHYGRHHIIYTKREDEVIIERLLHDAMDIDRLLLE